MKPYFVGMGFAPLLIFAHFFMPSWFFMIIAFSMLFFFCQMAANHKEPVFEWPELSFSQIEKTIILTMSTKDGKSIDRYISINRLNLPKTVVEKTVEKTRSSIWHVLGMMPTTDSSAVEKAFRKMSMVYHPDAGGTSKSFNTLVEAKEKALQKCR